MSSVAFEETLYGIIVKSSALLGFLLGEIFFLGFGILAVIPSLPFTERDFGFGVTAIVLSLVGLTGICGMIVLGSNCFLII